jgi:transcriptional regulator GlxA family with amidase domain
MEYENFRANSTLGATPPPQPVQLVLTLLERALAELNESHAARHALGEAALLVRQKIGPEPDVGGASQRGHLLAWQARKVRDYFEAHLAGPLRVADVGAVIQRSEAHFSRAFKQTFGVPPHAYLSRLRVERAAYYMLQTDASLSDIALRCGFTDQAHLCKHFRQFMGNTPAAWRRVRRALTASIETRRDP